MGKKVKKKKLSTEKRPHEVKDLFETAYSYHVKGDYPKAEETYKQIIRLEPRHSNALNLLGTICLERGEYDNALDLIRKAVKAYPMGAMFHNNLGNVFRKMGMPQDAEKAYREALRVAPDNVAANNNLGIVLHEQGDMEGAIGYYEKAHRHDPGFSPAFYNLGRVFTEQGRIETAIWAYREALKINPGFHDAYSNLLYTLHFSDKVTPEQIFDEHKIWAKSFAETYYPEKPLYANNTDKERRLRIGYVSPDFRTHSVAFFFENVISYHDRNQVEVFCYSSTEKPDDLTRHFRELADGWRDISCLSDDEAASIIKKDQIDILIDLAGHTGGSRILLFARKPAPVQVTWLGYPDTTGLDSMDYRLTDAIADPPGLTDHLSTEKLVRLDGGFLCYRPSGESYPISPSPFIAAGAVTFGSFNNNSKISESVISAWSQIMKKTPGSRLKLKSRSFADLGTRRYILERFDHYGIPSERIWFEGYKVSMKEHFLLYGTVDIALDTFPYNGTTTTCEALWMGVPVIALRGKAHASRVGASLLHQVGLDDFIAFSEEEYVEKAVALSKNNDLLVGLRSVLRQRLSESTLFNAKVFSSNIETVFRGMWEKWVEEGACANSENITSRDAGFFEKNLITLRQYHPLIEALLDEKAPFDMEVRITSSGIPNLYINKKQGEVFVLYPENKLLEDLAYIKKTIEPVAGKVLCVMGAGLFIHAKPILEMVGNKNIVVFFEAYPAVFRAALESHDLTAVIAHPNARFAIGDSADPYKIINEERDNMFTNDNGEFVEYNRAVSLAPEWYKDKRRAFDQFLKRRKISLDTVAFSGKSFLANSFNNLLALSESLPLDILSNSFKGIPVIIVASGPSLSQNIHELKNIKDKALIIALDSALAPLMAHGVKPHMIVSIDNNDFTYEKLVPFVDDLSDVDLLYIPNVTPKIVNGIRFKSKYYSFPDTSIQNLFNHLLGRKGTSLEDIHSVIHLALAAAQIAGCDPIVFIGLDLAFSGTKDHASGTILDWGNNYILNSSTVMVESIHGDMIPSSNGFVGMLEICQRMIQTLPDRTYIDATEGGAKISGTLIMSLAEAIERYCSNTIKHPGIKHDGSSMLSPQVVLNNLKRLKDDLARSFKNINRYEKVQKTVEHYIDKNGSDRIDPHLLPSTIIQSAQTMDKINSLLEQDLTVSFAKSVMVQDHNKYKSLELDVIGKTLSKSERFVAALKQQAFVQIMRKNGIEFLSEQVDQSNSFFETLTSIEQRGELSTERLLELIEILVDLGCIVKAEMLLEEMAQCPEKDYCLGCIAIKKAQIKKGETLFRNAWGQTSDLLPKITSFKETAVQEWLKEDKLLAFRKICIDRVLELEPENSKAVFLKQQWLYNRALNLIGNGQVDSALDELLAESKGWQIDDSLLLTVFSLLSLSRGHVEEGLDQLKRSIKNNYDNPNHFSIFSYCYSKIFSGNSIPLEFTWVKDLVAQAKNSAWAKHALQEIFCVNIEDQPGSIMRKQISIIELEAIDLLLETWKEIKDIIPDWYYLKSHKLLAIGDFDEAELTLKQAITIERHTIQLKGRTGFLHYLLCMFALYMGNEKKAVSIIQEVILSYPDNHFKLTASLLFIRNNEEDKAETLLKDIFHENNDLSWIRYVGETYLKGDLIREFSKYKSLSFLSAYFFIIGKCCMNGELVELGLIFLRAAINHDLKILTLEDGLWLHGLILNKWEEDVKNVETALSAGNFKEAEKHVEEWRETRSALYDYHTVVARIIATKENEEKAIDYLQSFMGEVFNNPYVLLYLAKLLFVCGRREEARVTLERAVVLNSDTAGLWEDMGDVWFEEQDYPMAIMAYEKCLTALPEKIDVLRKIGDGYKAIGRFDAAIMAYSAVIEKDGANEIAKSHLKDIQG